MGRDYVSLEMVRRLRRAARLVGARVYWYQPRAGGSLATIRVKTASGRVLEALYEDNARAIAEALESGEAR